YFFFSSRRRHTRFSRDWSSDVCSSDLRATPDNAGDYHYRRLVAMRAASALAYNRNRNGEDITPVSAIAIASYETGIDFELLVMRSEERRVGKECRVQKSTAYWNQIDGA